MRVILRFAKHRVVKPILRSGKVVLVANLDLWGTKFGEVWEPLPLDKKLAWFLFLNHTIAILTLIELLFLKKFNR